MPPRGFRCHLARRGAALHQQLDWKARRAQTHYHCAGRLRVCCSSGSAERPRGRLWRLGFHSGLGGESPALASRVSRCWHEPPSCHSFVEVSTVSALPHNGGGAGRIARQRACAIPGSSHGPTTRDHFCARFDRLASSALHSVFESALPGVRRNVSIRQAEFRPPSCFSSPPRHCCGMSGLRLSRWAGWDQDVVSAALDRRALVSMCAAPSPIWDERQCVSDPQFPRSADRSG